MLTTAGGRAGQGALWTLFRRSAGEVPPLGAAWFFGFLAYGRIFSVPGVTFEGGKCRIAPPINPLMPHQNSMNPNEKQYYGVKPHNSLFEQAVRQLPLPTCAAFTASGALAPVSFVAGGNVPESRDKLRVAEAFPLTSQASGSTVLKAAATNAASKQGKRVAVLFSGGPASGGGPCELGRLSTAVVQRFCKPKVGGSIPSAGTILPQTPQLPGRAASLRSGPVRG